MLIVYLLMISGAGFILVAAIGVVRFRDTYSRMHATTKATSFGILLLLAGVCLFFADGVVLLKALLIILFIYLTAPLAAHSIASSHRKKEDEGEICNHQQK